MTGLSASGTKLKNPNRIAGTNRLKMKSNRFITMIFLMNTMLSPSGSRITLSQIKGLNHPAGAGVDDDGEDHLVSAGVAVVDVPGGQGLIEWIFD